MRFALLGTVPRVAAFTLTLVAAAAQAGYIDTDHQREWVEASAWSWNRLQAACSPETGICDGALTGWVWAGGADLAGLWSHLGMSTYPIDWPSTFSSSNGSGWALPYFDTDGDGPATGVFQTTSIDALLRDWGVYTDSPLALHVRYRVGQYEFSSFQQAEPDDRGYSAYLFRDVEVAGAVPEPASLALVGIGLLTAGVAIRRARR